MDYKNAWAFLKGKALFSITLLIAVAALILILIDKILRTAKVIQALLERELLWRLPTPASLLLATRTLRHIQTDASQVLIRARRVPALQALHLTPAFPAKHLEYRGLILILEHKGHPGRLELIRFPKAGIDQTLNKDDQKLVGVLLRVFSDVVPRPDLVEFCQNYLRFGHFVQSDILKIGSQKTEEAIVT